MIFFLIPSTNLKSRVEYNLSLSHFKLKNKMKVLYHFNIREYSG